MQQKRFSSALGILKKCVQQLGEATALLHTEDRL